MSARLYQISRKTGYKWLERFRQGGFGSLGDRSHAAHHQPRRIAEDLEQRLIEARRRHPSWGPKKLRAWLEWHDPETHWPAASTVGEALKRAGLVNERRRSRRLAAEPSPLREPARANDLWTIDYKGQFHTGDGVLCYPLTVVDAHSRYLLSYAARVGTSYPEARSSLERLFLERGLLRRIRSDNGSPFASTGEGRLSRLNVWWSKLGIAVERIAPDKPQQNPRHERMHRTLKAETARPPARERQQQRFDRFCDEYNQERPHEALGQRPPATLYVAAEGSYPTQIPEPEYAGHWELRRVRKDGRVKFQGRMYFLSEALAGEITGWVEVNENIWQIWGRSKSLSTTQPRGLSDPWARPLAAPHGAANLSPILLPIRPVVRKYYAYACPPYFSSIIRTTRSNLPSVCPFRRLQWERLTTASGRRHEALKG